jgi:transglutaminase-like putative cysteine protease
MKTKIKILISLFSGISLLMSAQKKDMTEEYLKKYPDDNAVYLERKEYNTIKVEKGQVRVYTKNHSDLLLLSDKVSSYSDVPIYYSSFSTVSGIKGQSLIPDGKGNYKTVPATDKYVSNEFSAGTFYDDFKATHLVFTGLTTGSRTQLDYTEKLLEPRFFGRFFFSLGLPTENAEFTVDVPKGVKIEWKLFNIDEKDLEFTKVESKKKTVYTWRKRNSPKYEIEGGAPSSTYFAPHIIVYITEYTVKKEVKKMLDGPAGLYTWYYSMVKDVNAKTDESLQLVVDSLVKGVTDEQEKVKRIFYWVQDNIKYVAFEDGMGGFVPREAHIICSRRYGDCKDMASITNTMLRMAGIQSYLTWIGTRNIPYRYLDVPSPMSDNHMICTYFVNGSYYFLDATGRNMPFGTPTSMIQGKEAMLCKGEGKYEIVQVPIVDAEKNARTDTVWMRIEANNDVVGKGSMTVNGYEKIDLMFALDAKREKEKRDYFKNYLEKGTNKFVIDSLHYFGLSQRDGGFSLQYNYTIGGYAHRNGDDIYANMQLDKGYVNFLLDTADRTTPYEIEYQFSDKHITILELPEGYNAACLPPDARYENAKFGFEITYRQEGNKIIAIKKIWVKTLLINPSDFVQWNEFIAALTKACSENVTLRKTAPVVKPQAKAKK